MNHADAPAELSTPPDPPQERCKPVPSQIAYTLTLLHVLLVYGRHLALTLEVRAAAGRFAVIAQFFGTARLAVLRARLARGLLRIQALQHVLLARARRGRDIVWLKPLQPRRRAPRPPKPALPLTADSQSETPPHRPAPVRRPDRDAAPDLDHLPTLAQLEAEIRRRGIGAAFADICRDFGVAPNLCEREFFSALFDTIHWHRGNFTNLAKDFHQRAKVFVAEWDSGFTLGLPDRDKEDILRVLGFFIGERWPRLPVSLPPPYRERGSAAPRPP